MLIAHDQRADRDRDVIDPAEREPAVRGRIDPRAGDPARNTRAADRDRIAAERVRQLDPQL
jgi:hypothetical protein